MDDSEILHKAVNILFEGNLKPGPCDNPINIKCPHDLELVFPCGNEIGKYHIAENILEGLAEALESYKIMSVRPVFNTHEMDHKIYIIYDIFRELEVDQITAEEATERIILRIATYTIYKYNLIE